MVNVTMAVKIIMPEQEAIKLSNGAEVTVVMCDKCFALVPLTMIIAHDQKVHSGT